jgi:hypothetical protein
MMKESEYQGYRWLAGLLVLLILLLSCESKDEYVGLYKAEGQREIILELKENGDGLWKVGSDKAKGTFVEVPFAWYIKRGDLRMNTKAGGVIVGKIDKDTIRITLPGSKILTFRKTR